MKLEDFKSLKRTMLTNMEPKLRGYIQDQFLANKELVVQLTDEEQRMLAYEMRKHAENTNFLNLVKVETNFSKTGVYDDTGT